MYQQYSTDVDVYFSSQKKFLAELLLHFPILPYPPLAVARYVKSGARLSIIRSPAVVAARPPFIKPESAGHAPGDHHSRRGSKDPVQEKQKERERKKDIRKGANDRRMKTTERNERRN
ncbi:hypothetical protein C0Q70_15117 [Pomacea canaliculata]|uniref:Uncharacterized protein n=1 Tax=Pomacea canaliculata TaxID=400727 RepID=A0A2T7NU03_POMCA|nr:hypothetical protein C0Q70_15117 [Pomacea canaliculata]